jgi:hypothetical protein
MKAVLKKKGWSRVIYKNMKLIGKLMKYKRKKKTLFEVEVKNHSMKKLKIISSGGVLRTRENKTQ